MVGGCGSRQQALLWEGAAWRVGAKRGRDLVPELGYWSLPGGTGSLVLFVIGYLFLLSAFLFFSSGLSCFCDL